MEATAEKLFQAREFARQTGVTVRTLHLYDRLGLLEPAARTESGYRLYGEAQLERLEHILALRFVGFRLEHIKELLQGPKWPLLVALRMQHQVVANEKRRLERAMAAIEDAERALEDDAADRWKTLRNVIGALNVKNDLGWTKNYYSEAAQQKVQQRMEDTPKEVIEQGQRDWTALLAEVEEAAARNEDPQSSHAQALAERWRGLLRQFTGGDSGIQLGLNKLWSDQTHWPADFKRPWSDTADAWIKRVMNCRQ